MYRNCTIYLGDDIFCSGVHLHILNRSYPIKTSKSK